MNYEISPKSEIRTQLPITIKVEGENPRVDVEGLGRIELKGAEEKTAQIYFSLPGEYKVTFTDGELIKHEVISVKQQVYLDFKNEFGVFFILFLMVMGGIIIWTRKIMRNKTEKI